MTLKQLEAFYWATVLGSFARAAARLHVSQSTLSKRIGELEQDLGQILFDRNSQRIALTDAGLSLVDRAGQMLEIEGGIRADLAIGGVIRGPLRCGITELVAATWFPLFVERTNRDFKGLALEPQVDLSAGLERKLERGELDFAVIPGPSTSPLLMGVKVSELDYRWMAAPSRLSAGTLLKATHFTQHPVISLNPDSRLSRTFDEWTHNQGLDIPRTVVCNSLTALIALTVSGVGISYFPRTYLRYFIRSGKLVELNSEPPLPTLSYYFNWRKDDHRHIVKAMKEIVLEIADFSRSPLWDDLDNNGLQY
ncbi:LysR family transcriptional regulator [Pseudomonas mohnii]